MDDKELQDWQDWSEAYESGTKKGKEIEKEKEIDEEGGAGEDGTPELTAKYKKDTAGETADVPNNSVDWLKDAMDIP